MGVEPLSCQAFILCPKMLQLVFWSQDKYNHKPITRSLDLRYWGWFLRFSRSRLSNSIARQQCDIPCPLALQQNSERVISELE